MNEKMSKRDKITLAIFVFITITAGFFGYLLDQVLTEQPEGNSLGMGLWLVLPFLTGIVLRIINKDMKQMSDVEALKLCVEVFCNSMTASKEEAVMNARIKREVKKLLAEYARFKRMNIYRDKMGRE